MHQRRTRHTPQQVHVMQPFFQDYHFSSAPSILYWLNTAVNFKILRRSSVWDKYILWIIGPQFRITYQFLAHVKWIFEKLTCPWGWCILWQPAGHSSQTRLHGQLQKVSNREQPQLLGYQASFRGALLAYSLISGPNFTWYLLIYLLIVPEDWKEK